MTPKVILEASGEPLTSSLSIFFQTLCLPFPNWNLGFSEPGKWVKTLPAKEGDMRGGFEPWVGKIPWRRKWQSTAVFLPRESHGQRYLAGYSLWGCKESNTEQLTLSLSFMRRKEIQPFAATWMEAEDNILR